MLVSVFLEVSFRISDFLGKKICFKVFEPGRIRIRISKFLEPDPDSDANYFIFGAATLIDSFLIFVVIC